MLDNNTIGQKYSQEQPVLQEESPAVKKQIDSYRFIDLFAGVGGFRLGFKAKFSSCVFSSEWDKFAAQTYQANFGESPFGDINGIRPKDIPDHEILLAGFPCQPFSHIGKRQGFRHKTQGTLFYNIAEILRNKKPAAFVLENVVGLKTHKSGNEKTLSIILEILQELEYEPFVKVIDSADFALPQKRKRLFIVGFLRENFRAFTPFQWPKPSKRKKYVSSILEKGVSGYSISKHLQNKYLFKVQDGRPEIIDQDSRHQVKTLVSTYHKIQRLTGTFVRDGRTGLRLLTSNECKALMGFPKKFIIPVSRTQMYRQLGNSVAVPVVKAIAGEVFKTLDEVFSVDRPEK